MLALLDRDLPGLAAIHLRGSDPATPDVLGHLRGLGYELVEGDVPAARWSVRLRHPTLGIADVWADETAIPLRDHVADATTLTPGERALANGPSSPVLLRVPPRWGDVRRDRKTLLRIAAAILGDRGLLVVDLGSRLAWSRAALADELAHDADLDIEALYSVHTAPYEAGPNGASVWLHTHGLDDLGATDIEFLGAHPAFAAAGTDPIRAIAAMLLDGAGAEPRPVLRFGHPGGTAQLVPVTDFLRRARPEVRARRATLVASSGHAGRRAILCEPPGRRFLGRGRDASPRPLELARRRPPDRFVVYVPPAATTLMAERAHGTLGVLQARMAEFADRRPKALVKLGYPTRDGGQEHLWFEAHGFTDAGVIATLQNEPLGVDLRPGTRAERPLDLLTDWALVTSAGWITPRSSLATRRLREEAAADHDRASEPVAASESVETAA